VTIPSQVSDIDGGEPACRPGSVRPLARGGGHPSRTAVADSLVRSTREHRAGRPRSLAQGTVGSPLDLAPGGVYRAAAVTCGAGGLLHRRFTLTPHTRHGAVCFLWHFPAGRPGSALPTTLPCGARTFLTGRTPGAAARPTHPPSGYAERHLSGVPDRIALANDGCGARAARPDAPFGIFNRLSHIIVEMIIRKKRATIAAKSFRESRIIRDNRRNCPLGAVLAT
jgi:hypothetical protein